MLGKAALMIFHCRKTVFDTILEIVAVVSKMYFQYFSVRKIFDSALEESR